MEKHQGLVNKKCLLHYRHNSQHFEILQLCEDIILI